MLNNNQTTDKYNIICYIKAKYPEQARVRWIINVLTLE